MTWEEYRENLWLEDAPEETIFECEKAWNAAVQACIEQADCKLNHEVHQLGFDHLLTDNQEEPKT